MSQDVRVSYFDLGKGRGRLAKQNDALLKGETSTSWDIFLLSELIRSSTVLEYEYGSASKLVS